MTITMVAAMAKGVARFVRKAPPIEHRFEFDGDGVVTTARAELRATLYEVRERESGDEFCLKLWRKTGTTADTELRELWRHEMRHVQRVESESVSRNPGRRNARAPRATVPKWVRA